VNDLENSYRQLQTAIDVDLENTSLAGDYPRSIGGKRFCCHHCEGHEEKKGKRWKPPECPLCHVLVVPKIDLSKIEYTWSFFGKERSGRVCHCCEVEFKEKTPRYTLS